MGYNKRIIGIFFLAAVLPAAGQSKQVKQYLEQIAANKVYIDYLQKGWQLARDGLRFIGDKHYREYSLHRLFYDRLLLVNPAIAALPVVRNYTSSEERLTAWLEKLRSQMQQSDHLPGLERTQREEQLQTLLDEQAARYTRWVACIRDGQSAMEDAERWQRVQTLAAESQRAMAQARSLWIDGQQLQSQRKAEIKDAAALRICWDKK